MAFWKRLHRAKKKPGTKKKQSTKLPYLFPIVVYSGSGTYPSPVALRELIQFPDGFDPEEAASYGPSLKFFILSLCNISDFSSTMSHLEFIMGSESGYLFFVLPSAAYLVLFVLYDMKMLFLVWRSHNIRRNDTPDTLDTLRRRLTAFYIQFCNYVWR